MWKYRKNIKCNPSKNADQIIEKKDKRNKVQTNYPNGQIQLSAKNANIEYSVRDKDFQKKTTYYGERKKENQQKAKLEKKKGKKCPKQKL